MNILIPVIRKVRWAFNTFKYAIIILLAFFIVFKFFLGVVIVPSESMEDTIAAESVVFYSKLHKAEVNRGDIVIFYSEEDNMDLIKRVIGTPESVVLIDKDSVYYNGTLIDEPYKKGRTFVNNEEDRAEYAVPAGKMFVMGDNRENSSDSRYFNEPYIGTENIKGKALFSIALNDKPRFRKAT